MAETPCQKCKRERDRYRKEAAELRMARENDAQRWKAAVEREHARAEELEERVAELETELDKARSLLAEAGSALGDGAKALRAVIAERRG